MTKKNKFFAVSASAALVASAIVPVAASASEQFGDASKIASWATDAVSYFVEQEVIGGKPGNLFDPQGKVTRAEAAKMFAVGLEYGEDAEVTFADTKGHWAAGFIGAVASAKVVNGYEDGTFQPEKSLTRAEAAKMMVEALGFEGEADLSKYADVKAGQWYVQYLEAAVANKVLNGKSATTMDPNGQVSREEFATMLYRAFDAADLIVKEEQDNEELETAVEAMNAIEIAKATAANLDEVKAAIASLENAIAAVEAFNSEDAEVLAAVKAAKEAVEAAKAEVAVVEATPVALAIASTKAVNPTTVEVKFNRAVDSVEDITVSDAKTAQKQYVKEIKLSEDKMSATVTLFDTLAAKSTYKVAAKAEGSTIESSFDYTVGEAKTIELAAQTVADTKNVEYKVLDENGLDITSLVKVEVESDKNVFTAKEGAVSVNWAGNESAFVKFTVKKDGKVIAESARVSVTAKAAAKETTFGTNWTVGTANFAADDYKAETSVALGSTKALTVEVLDQYGEAIELTNATVKYTSLDTSVAVIDMQTGAITPRKEGKVALKAELVVDEKVIDTKVVELAVTAKAKFTSVELDKSELNVTVGGKTEVVEFDTLDQFGNEIALTDEEVTVKSSDEKVAKAVVANNKVTVTAVAEGTATVTLKVGTVEKTIAVKVAEVGTIVDYKLEGFVADLKTKDDGKTEDVAENEMTITVYGKDANGTLDTKATASTYEITDKDGKVVKAGTAADEHTIAFGPTFEAGETYTLTVKVGTLTVATEKFTVTENGIAPTVKVVKDKLTVTEGDTVKDALANLIQFTADENVDVEITEVTYISNNAAVVASSDAADVAFTAVDGTAEVYVSSIEVEVQAKSGKDVDPKLVGTFTLENDWKFTFNNDLTGPELKEITTAKVVKNAAGNFEVTFVADLQEALYYTYAGEVLPMVAGKGDVVAYNTAFTATNGTVTSAELDEDLKSFTVTVELDANATETTVGFAGLTLPLTDAFGNEFTAPASYKFTVANDKVTVAEVK